MGLSLFFIYFKPTVLIREGKFEEENLTTLGLSKSWINTQLQAQNITAASDVFLAKLIPRGSSASIVWMTGDRLSTDDNNEDNVG